MRKQEAGEYEKSMGVGTLNSQIRENERYESKDARFRKRPLQKQEKERRRDKPAGYMKPAATT